MSKNIEEIKKKIIYRASYRGTKEMDILISNFVQSIINKLDINQLFELDRFVSLDDESLKKIKNKNNIKINLSKFLINEFQDFQ